MLLEAKPVDGAGSTIPHDHEEIADGDFLIRGISQAHIVNKRVSSGAFKSSSDPYKGLSVDLERLAEGRSYKTNVFVGAVKFTATTPREKDLIVGYDPVTVPNENLAHCQVWRTPNPVPARIPQGASRHMRNNSIWHEMIEGVDL